MPKAMVLSFSNLASDPRVNRQIRFLQSEYQVLAVGLGDPTLEGVEYRAIPQRENLKQLCRSPHRFAWKLLKHFWYHLPGCSSIYHAMTQLETWAATFLHRYEQHYWNSGFARLTWELCRNDPVDVIVANDCLTLPLAVRLAEHHGAKLLFDAHEYAPLEFEDRYWWNRIQRPYATWICQKYLPSVDAMSTVCEGIAQEYQKLASLSPTVIWNAPDYESGLSPRFSQSETIQLVHHGAVFPSRKLELMIQMMDHVDERFELNLIFVGEQSKYRRRLEKEAQRRANIHLLPPVPMRELPRFLNQFDMGIFLLPGTNFNYRYALPNKFFEYIQARLAVAIGPSIEMAPIVHREGCGIVSDDFTAESLAKAFNQMTSEELQQYKMASNHAAIRYSTETTKSVFLQLLAGILDQRQAA